MGWLYKAYDKFLQSLRIYVINSEYANWTSEQHISEADRGTQNVSTYSRTALQMGNFTKFSLSYLLTTADTHNDVTLKVYATNKSDYTLPAVTVAIADTDEIFNISLDILGDAAGKTINNATIGDIIFVDTPIKPEYLIFEVLYAEDNTAAPDNASELRVKFY